jgi:hypothetical protein
VLTLNFKWGQNMKTITLLFVLFAAFTIRAQDALVCFWRPASGAGGSVSYSVGQGLYTNTGSTGSLVQGVQQAFEIITLSNPELVVTLFAVAYPNPLRIKLCLWAM